MGTWGMGPFDNDHAADFAGDLDELPVGERIGAVEKALLVAAESEGELAADIGDHAVAAAAVIAADLPGGDPVGVYGPEEPLGAIPDWMPALALKALDRITGPESELAELWDDTEHGPQWRSVIRRLRRVLAARGLEQEGLWGYGAEDLGGPRS
ncbi:DUF4259 domain-containing protein [Streptomyces sp. NPDC051940]|uniref:DUF4259 domain-containing protein n=1 Tax=Streptomyces sp. NPDC051940 TaxID=3155675 RepID=UPI003412FF73